MGNGAVALGLEDREVSDSEHSATLAGGEVCGEGGCREGPGSTSDVDDGASDSSGKSLDFYASDLWVTRSWTSSQLGLEYCGAEQLRSNSCSLLFKGPELTLPRSKLQRKEIPQYDLKLDRLPEREKKKIIEDLIKIQNDGTVEVDVTQTAPVASELLEFDGFDSAPEVAEGIAFQLSKSIPRLMIAMLVVGTRGDVQPFIAFAKKLQEFGHHVRLATHVNFCSFVRSFGLEFYPLGGNPRVMAGFMGRDETLNREEGKRSTNRCY